MLKNSFLYLKHGNTFCGIEHTTQEDTDCLLVSVLKKQKNELLLTKSLKVNSIDNIPTALVKNLPVSLVINNNNVLFKTVQVDSNNTAHVVKKSFPNINIEDFYFDVLHQNNNNFIWICRKSYVDKIVSYYSKLNINITKVFIGNSLISNCFHFIKEHAVLSSNYEILKNDNYIDGFNKKITIIPRTYNINGIHVENNYLLSFAGALQHILPSSPLNSNFDNELIDSNFKQKRFFNLFSKFGLIFIFLSLIINFIFFNHYFTKVNDLKIVSQNNEQSKTRLLNLNKEVEKKQQIVDDLFKLKSSQSSFYTNAIINKTPSTILLTTFNFQPLKIPIKTNKEVVVVKNEITISGVSSNHDNFSKWLSTLDTITWINNVTIINYGSSKKSNSNFSIKIILKNDL